MKIFNLILTGLFVLFAAFQLNDPDPLFWVLVYVVMAVISGMAAFRKYNVLLMLLVLAVLAYELFVLFPPFMDWIRGGMPNIAASMKAESKYIELVREFLGLVICFAALTFHYITFRKWRLPESE